MHNWEWFDEKSIPEKKEFYSSLNTGNITDVDYRHAKKVYKEFNNNNLGDYHNFYVHADILENFRDNFINISKLDPAHFLSAPGLAWQACLKKTKIKLEWLTDVICC